MLSVAKQDHHLDSPACRAVYVAFEASQADFAAI